MHRPCLWPAALRFHGKFCAAALLIALHLCVCTARAVTRTSMPWHADMDMDALARSNKARAAPSDNNECDNNVMNDVIHTKCVSPLPQNGSAHLRQKRIVTQCVLLFGICHVARQIPVRGANPNHKLRKACVSEVGAASFGVGAMSIVIVAQGPC
eukprot:1159895-Pelagomonas_calceolata.AAC.4